MKLWKRLFKETILLIRHRTEYCCLFCQIGLNKLWYIGVVPLLITWIVFYLTLVGAFVVYVLFCKWMFLYLTPQLRHYATGAIEIAVYRGICFFNFIFFCLCEFIIGILNNLQTTVHCESYIESFFRLLISSNALLQCRYTRDQIADGISWI